MPSSSVTQVDVFEAALAGERPRVVRLCAAISGHPEAAEDLAQETLLEAWRNRHKLNDTAGFGPWLAAIARNVCLRWRRRMATSSFRRMTAEVSAEWSGRTSEGCIPDSFDLEIEFDREELVLLLDRAMGQLPPETREALVERYVRESPIGEVAVRLGVSEGAVAKRLERGKLIMRRVLETSLSEEVAAFGIVADPDAWQETRIWCPGCGARRLVGRYDAKRPLLALRCPSCHPVGIHTARTETLSLFAGLHGYKPALNRFMAWGHDYWVKALKTGEAICPRCQQTATPLLVMPPDGPLREVRGMHIHCQTCPPGYDISLDALGLWQPAGRRFWQQHGRIRTLPLREERAGGRRVLVAVYEAVASPSRLEAVFAADDYTLLDMRGDAVG